jgi:hypothetical protein
VSRRETRREQRIRKSLNPTSPAEIRVILKYEREVARARQKYAAYLFLTKGEDVANAQHIAPAYGKKWNRDYNPLPYPEAKPRGEDRIEMFVGTGIGTIYGFIDSGQDLWQLAGWTLTHRGPEVRRRRKW